MVAKVDRRRESCLDGSDKHEAGTVAQQLCAEQTELRVPQVSDE
jgi:hypothetical protein